MMVRLSGLVWRSLRANRRRSALTVAGAALGIGLMVAVVCLAAMARVGVEQQVQQEFGGIDLIIGSTDGRVGWTAADLEQIRRNPGVRDVGAALLPYMGHAFEETNMMRYAGLDPHPGVLRIFKVPRPIRDDEVMLNQELAAHLAVSAGETVELPFPDHPRTYRVGAVVATPERAGTPYAAYFSQTGLQQVSGRPGAATAVYIRLADRSQKENVVDDIRQMLQRQNPSLYSNLSVDMVLEADEARRNVGGLRSLGMVAGGLSLLVSLLLVVGITQFSLRERLQEIALLRAIGATHKQAWRTLMGEVLLLGALGAVAGGALGLLLALGAGRLVAGVLRVPMVTALPSWGQLAGALVAGWLLQAVAAWAPVRQAAKVPPVQAARQANEHDGKPSGKWGLPLTLLLIAALLQGIARAIPLASGEALRLLLAVLSGLLAAVGILASAWLLLSATIVVVRPLLTLRGRELIIAMRNVLNTQRQSRLTTAILGSALAVAVMAFTLTETTAKQQEQSLHAQFPTGLVAASRQDFASTIPWEKAQAIGRLPGVARSAGLGVGFGLDWSNHADFQVDPDFRRFWTRNDGLGLSIMPADFTGLSELGLIGPEVASRGLTAVITREMARQTGLSVGDSVRLTKMAGERRSSVTVDPLELQVGAILDEPLAGTRDVDILVDRDSLPLGPGADLLWRVLIDVQPGQTDLVEAGLAALKSSMPELAWSTENQARDVLYAQLRQRNAILGTGVGVLALLGMLAMVNTLTAGLHARRREHAMLRAAGLSVPRFFRLVLAENLLFAFSALMTGLLAGLGFTYAAVVPLGGWTLSVPWPIIGAVAGVCLSVTAAVSSFATRRVARTQVLEALRQE
jgi:putative ABC transport system permease protein